MITKAQQGAVTRYEARNYDKILLRVKKGQREEIQDAAEQAGESMNQFIVNAIKERMERM